VEWTNFTITYTLTQLADFLATTYTVLLIRVLKLIEKLKTNTIINLKHFHRYSDKRFLQNFDCISWILPVL